MGFGSYDESEQENGQQTDETDGEAVSVHEHDHDGEVTFESDADTDELVSRLGDIKGEADD